MRQFATQSDKTHTSVFNLRISRTRIGTFSTEYFHPPIELVIRSFASNLAAYLNMNMTHGINSHPRGPRKMQ